MRSTYTPCATHLLCICAVRWPMVHLRISIEFDLTVIKWRAQYVSKLDEVLDFSLNFDSAA